MDRSMSNTDDTLEEILLTYQNELAHYALHHDEDIAGRELQRKFDQAQSAIEAVIAAARIDELKELQMAPNVSDEAKDENYEGYIKDRVAQLQAREEKRK
jgi:hypothetical protein